MSLLRDGLITIWANTDINAGQEWEEEVQKHLKRADIVLLLISPDFIASDYYSNELQHAIVRHEMGETVVVPIILRPVDWSALPFGKLQALPKNTRPVTKWKNRDDAFLDITTGIRTVVDAFLAKQNVDASISRQAEDQEKRLFYPLTPPSVGLYERKWSLYHRGLLLILLDQSEDMNEVMMQGEQTNTLAEITTSFANSLLEAVVTHARVDSESGLIGDICDVMVIGYSDTVVPILHASGVPLPLPSITNRFRGHHLVSRWQYNPLKGQYEELVKRIPYWIEPTIRTGYIDFSQAIRVAREITQYWLLADARRADSGPPLILNITGSRRLAKSLDDPIEEAKQLRQMRTSDGEALLFSYYFVPSIQRMLVFPSTLMALEQLGLSSEEFLVAEQLYLTSSVLSDKLVYTASLAFSEHIHLNARGFLCNSDALAVIRLIADFTIPNIRNRVINTNIWPSIDKYDEAFQEAYITIYDDDIKYSKLLQNPLGPAHLNVNTDNVCIYRMGDWLVRCFVGNPPDDLRERYLAANEYIDLHGEELSFLVPQIWIEKGVHIERQDWPFVKSPYIQHISLGRFLRESIFSNGKNQAAITKIAQLWLQMIMTLEKLHIAHGDLDLTNVLVCGSLPDMRLLLVDFDNMYVPALAGRQLYEQGHKHFQPPESIRRSFNEEMDRFSALVIYLSLIALAEDPRLWEQCRADEESKLLLGTGDFQDLKNSAPYQLLRRKRGNMVLQKCLAELASSIEETRMPRALSEVVYTSHPVFPAKFHESKKFLLPSTNRPLSNLFEDDPLYAFPHPTKARVLRYTKDQASTEMCNSTCALFSDTDPFCFALTEGSGTFARPWAAVLAQYWTQHPIIIDVQQTSKQRYTKMLMPQLSSVVSAWLNEPNKRYEQWVYKKWLPTVNHRNHDQRQPLFSKQDVQRFIARGTSSTLIGVTLDRSELAWSSFAVGNSHLFLFSHENLGKWSYYSFPTNSLSELEKKSTSIPSMARETDQLSLFPQVGQGLYRPGDLLILATSALSRWLFIQVEQQMTDWNEMLNVVSDHDFHAFIKKQQEKGLLANEDTILIIIPLE